MQSSSSLRLLLSENISKFCLGIPLRLLHSFTLGITIHHFFLVCNILLFLLLSTTFSLAVSSSLFIFHLAFVNFGVRKLLRDPCFTDNLGAEDVYFASNSFIWRFLLLSSFLFTCKLFFLNQKVFFAITFFLVFFLLGYLDWGPFLATF